MKKNIVLAALIFVFIFTFVGCSGSSQSIDESFLDDMSKGLQARWTLVDAPSDDSGAVFESYIDAELNEIGSYKEEVFTDEQLEEYAKKYIDCLEKSKDLIKYYDADNVRFWSEYNPILDERYVLIKEIHDEYGLKVSEKYESNLNDMLTNAETVLATRDIMAHADFELVTEDYGWKTYEAIVENTSEMTFNYFYLNVNLVDGDGVVVESPYIYAENWKPGTKYKLSFETDVDFETIEVISCEYQ